MTATATTWTPAQFADQLTIIEMGEGHMIWHEESDLYFDVDGCWIPWEIVKNLDEVTWTNVAAGIAKATLTL